VRPEPDADGKRNGREVRTHRVHGSLKTVHALVETILEPIDSFHQREVMGVELTKPSVDLSKPVVNVTKPGIDTAKLPLDCGKPAVKHPPKD
jgi:hypothetical protein